jgi:hypothetical protein
MFTSSSVFKGEEMTLLRAFHNDAKIKEKYLSRVRAHKAADEIIHGTYGEQVGMTYKGCAVGCTIHSGTHAAYEAELGIPQILARLEDGIFEGLNSPRDKEWPEQFLESVPVGVDLSNIWPQFAIWILIDEQWGVLQFAKKDKTKESIKAVAKFYQESKYAKPEHYDEIRKIRAAAYAADATAAAAAAYAAAVAAYAAAAADAAAAAYAAAVATYAAYAATAADATAAAAAAYAAYAAYAAADAADAARYNWRNAQADKLIELLKEAK